MRLKPAARAAILSASYTRYRHREKCFSLSLCNNVLEKYGISAGVYTGEEKRRNNDHPDFLIRPNEKRYTPPPRPASSLIYLPRNYFRDNNIQCYYCDKITRKFAASSRLGYLSRLNKGRIFFQDIARTHAGRALELEAQTKPQSFLSPAIRAICAQIFTADGTVDCSRGGYILASVVFHTRVVEKSLEQTENQKFSTRSVSARKNNTSRMHTAS